jgi:hypothetical protein
MATLHKEYSNFNATISLDSGKKESLIKSRDALKDKIRKYFKDEKPKEIQPKFAGQGSTEMKTTVNPIPEVTEDGDQILKYDLDYGVYFIEKDGEDNKRNINTWHDWVYNAVENHTNTPPEKKNTCIRVIFADGHHIDLPIYYKKDEVIQLAHKTKDWLDSDPKEFFDWFNNKAKDDQQLRRIVRYLKAWKNYRESNNANLKLPSGFALTILAVNSFSSNDSNDVAFKDTVTKIKVKLNETFECLRPTTPLYEDIFKGYSDTKKADFLNALDSIVKACDDAFAEKNFKKASEYLRKQFGDRFPLGKDEDEEAKSARTASYLSATVTAKPYAK